MLCGRQATDWDFGVTGLAIAELHGHPLDFDHEVVSVVDGKVQAERVLGDSFETVEVPTPCVVSVSNELGEPRYPKLPQIMQAARKQVTVWTAADLGPQPGPGRQGRRAPQARSALHPAGREPAASSSKGDSPAEMAVNLAQALREAKLI